MIIDTYNTQFIATSGSGVIGITGKPVYMGGVLNGSSSGQGVQLYGFSGAAAVTMAVMTVAANTYLPFPAAFASGLTYQPFSNPGDAVLRLTFFWLPGSST